MKIFRRISVILALACAVMCFSVFATACGDDDKGANAYTVKLVYEDGTAVNGTELDINAQLCLVDKDGNTVTCYGVIATPDASGTLTFPTDKIPALNSGEKLHVQINKLDKEVYTYDSDADSAYFTAPGTTTITIKKV